MGYSQLSAQCGPPFNISCDDSHFIDFNCDDCMSGQNTFYTQCSPNPSFLPPALNVLEQTIVPQKKRRR